MGRVAGLILLCLLTFVFGIGRSAIQDSDEAFYAEAGREMVATGDWTTPHYNFEPRIQKPILFYWLVALTYQVTGVSEWAARLWSGLAGVGLALVAALVGRRWSGSGVGLLAGAIVATSFGVVPLGRQALPDMLLALLISVAIWAAIEAVGLAGVPAPPPSGPRLSPAAWLHVSAAASALGMLAKGPVAVVLPVTALAPLVWWEWRRRRAAGAPLPLRVRHIATAVGLFLLIAAPWYIAITQALGIDYARQFFVGENLQRFATPTYNTWRGWLYAPVIVAGLLPWSAFGLLWLPSFGAWRRGRRPLTAADRWLVCWAAGPLAFFLVSVGSQPRYILPCLVPLAVLLARSIWRHASGAVHPRRGILFVSALAAGGSMVLVGALLWRAAAAFADPGLPPLAAGPMAMTAIGLLTTLGVCLVPPRVVPTLIVLGAAAGLTVFHASLLSPGRPEPVEFVAQRVRAEAPGVRLCSCGALGRSLVFYARLPTEIADVTPDRLDEALRFLETPDRVLAAVDARALAGLESRLGRRFPRLREVMYLNTSVWQRGETLIRPDPTAVQRVILIANR